MAISAVVLTKNEEENIDECLESLKWCNEIVVVDDYSTDKTIQIAKEKGARVLTHNLNNDFAAQRNFVLREVEGEWVLFIDADERVSPKLKDEILRAVSNQNKNGGEKCDAFFLKRQDFFGGRALKFGETANVKLLRLARKGVGKWTRKVHEVWQIENEAGELSAPILHYPHPTISEFLEEIDFYSSLHAQVLGEQGIKPSLFRVVANPAGKFLQNYLLRQGFRDGEPGIIVALMMAFHSFLARVKLFHLWKE